MRYSNEQTVNQMLLISYLFILGFFSIKVSMERLLERLLIFNEDIKLENNPKIDMDLDSLADEEETEKNFHEQEIQEEQRDLNEMLHKFYHFAEYHWF